MFPKTTNALIILSADRLQYIMAENPRRYRALPPSRPRPIPSGGQSSLPPPYRAARVSCAISFKCERERICCCLRAQWFTRGQGETSSANISTVCPRSTICPGSSYPFYIVTHYMNWGNYFLDTQYYL